jgi:hypothetical protein
MTTFTVDPLTLEALQQTISSLYEELSNMNRCEHSFAGAVGGGDLEGQIKGFIDAWHTGVGLIEGDMQKVVQRLGEAAQAYAQSETYITQASCPAGG